MSMEVRTILELIQVFTVYSVCVLLCPYIVFRYYLRKKTLAEKFILCTIIGNFYIINIVFVIFLLHIPSRLTLYLFSIVPAVVAWVRINRPPVARFFTLLYKSFSRLFLGEAKIRTISALLLTQPTIMIKNTVKSIFFHAKHHFWEWVMLLGFLSFDIWYYAYQTYTKYSYGTSDIIVHHYWVNQMSEGTIFFNGIYPFGFHNIIYFINNFFGIRMLSIMRVFGVVETLYIILMIYVLLRKICHSKYIPFVGIFLFSIPNFFSVLTNMRYQWSLPQEYAMLFLYPCAYFLIQFFERKRQEIQTEREWRKKNKLYAWPDQYHILSSTRSLVFFAMSFSMTLAVHFYITIIAVLLCLAIAIAYFPIVLHPRFFCSIALAGILSLMSAVAPMGIAYLQGTPLEGSLRWALGVINSSSDGGEGESEDTTDENELDTSGEADPSADTDGQTQANSPESGQTPSGGASQNLKERVLSLAKSVFGGIKTAAIKIYDQFNEFHTDASYYLCNVCNGEEVTVPLLRLTEGIIAFTALLVLLRRKFYYRNLLSVGLYMLFLVLLACASIFHLPSLMDLGRTSIFLAYAAPLLGACTADALFYISCKPFRYHRFMEVLPIGLIGLLTFLTINHDYVKPLSIVYAIQPSGEVECNYRIMEHYPDKSWTIVTTTNSLQIVTDHGWHMEICTFLNGMEEYTADSRVTIPTKYVFFYIEKTPLLYGTADLVLKPLANSGLVSSEAASQPAIFQGGNVYSTQNRMILESKMYYWAKTFQQKYPQEFQVYYEDEYFVCYRIVQNTFHLYNFAVDYGFNS